VEISWDQIASPIQRLLGKYGFTGETLQGRIAELRLRNKTRVKEGDRDHLIYYVLQSMAFTRLPPIEPALSAQEFVDGGRIPSTARARMDAFAAAARTGRNYGARMAIFRDMLAREAIDLSKEYERAMKFAAPAGAQYQSRGLSTDTTINAGYAVFLTLAALRRLEPDRRIHTVLVIGPGLDLAPRTGFVEREEPQSYQPFAVMDALVATGLSIRDDLRVTAADINPRVAKWIAATVGTRPRLTFVAGIEETGRVRLTEDYRDYISALGGAIGEQSPLHAVESMRPAKSIVVAREMTNHLDAHVIDITTERLSGRYDLAVVTNVFPYLADPELLLAVSNIVSMLNPGGVLIHNEPRPALADALLALEIPLLQSRSAVIATVQGGAPPLYDSVWMHVKSAAEKRP
jgi:hypothetical protein